MQTALYFFTNIITYIVIGIITCVGILIFLLSKLNNAVKTLRDLQGLQKDRFEIENLKLDINNKKSKIYIATLNDIEKFDSKTKKLIYHAVSHEATLKSIDMPEITLETATEKQYENTNANQYVDYLSKISKLIFFRKLRIVIFSFITIILFLILLLLGG